MENKGIDKIKKDVDILSTVVLYLRIFMRNKNFYKLKQSKFRVDLLYMQLMGERNGIPQLIKFFEDGHPIAIHKEYEKTK